MAGVRTKKPWYFAILGILGWFLSAWMVTGGIAWATSGWYPFLGPWKGPSWDTSNIVGIIIFTIGIVGVIWLSRRDQSRVSRIASIPILVLFMMMTMVFSGLSRAHDESPTWYKVLIIASGSAPIGIRLVSSLHDTFVRRQTARMD